MSPFWTILSKFFRLLSNFSEFVKNCQKILTKILTKFSRNFDPPQKIVQNVTFGTCFPSFGGVFSEIPKNDKNDGDKFRKTRTKTAFWGGCFGGCFSGNFFDKIRKIEGQK